jgi:hypothetical protein
VVVKDKGFTFVVLFGAMTPFAAMIDGKGCISVFTSPPASCTAWPGLPFKNIAAIRRIVV